MAIEYARLKRLHRIRKLMERQRQLELQRAMSALQQTEQAVAGQTTAQLQAQMEGKQALATGSQDEWLLAEAAGEIARWNLDKLKVLHKARSEETRPARELYLQSRREQEQLAVLVEKSTEELQQEDLRRAQMAADDWYARRYALRRQEP
ncbi:MAG: hypothetical protein ACYC46_10730 [Acidobacteriaceae bacterium]